MKYTILLFALTYFVSPLKGQNRNSIEGIVHNEYNEAIPYASVVLEGTSYGTATDIEGKFDLMAPVGKYRLIISSLGYAKSIQQVELFGNNKTIIPIVHLKENQEELHEVLVTTSKSEYKVDRPSGSLRLNQPLIEVPQNIQVITAEALADQQVISMNDGVLRNVSGATKMEHWGNLYTRVNMRGYRASAFRNGMNVTSSWGPLNEDMSMVSHLEFVKGPAGFMMSNGEPSGIYNVVTKKPTGQSRGTLAFTMGSFELNRGTLDLDGKLNKSGKLLYRLNLMGQTMNSFQDYSFTNRYSIAPVISYQLDKNTLFTAEYAYQRVKMSDVGSAYVFATDGYAGLPYNFTTAEPGLDPTSIEDHSLMLNLQHEFNKNWKITGQLAYFNYDQEGSSLWPSSIDEQGNMIRSVGIWDAFNESSFGQVFVNGEVETGAVAHRILAGLDVGSKEYMADWSQAHPLDTPEAYFNIYHPVYGSPANGLPTFDRSKSLKQRANTTSIVKSYSGLYLQEELGFIDNKLRLTLAGRYTFVKENSYGTTLEDSKLTPRLGLSLSLNPSTSLYGLFDQSFVPQTALLRNNKKPKPITGNNLEMGIKREWFKGRWSTGLSAYRIIKNNQLVPDMDPTDNADYRYSLQLGQTLTQGLEFDVRGELFQGMNVIANYAYTDSEISKDTREGFVGNTVPGFAKHLANGWLSYQLQEGWIQGFKISGGFSYQVDRSTWSWAATNQLPLPDYFRLDAGISWENDQLNIQVNVFNLLDKYLYSGSPYAAYYYWQAEAPRNSRLSLAYKF